MSPKQVREGWSITSHVATSEAKSEWWQEFLEQCASTGSCPARKKYFVARLMHFHSETILAALAWFAVFFFKYLTCRTSNNACLFVLCKLREPFLCYDGTQFLHTQGFCGLKAEKSGIMPSIGSMVDGTSCFSRIFVLFCRSTGKNRLYLFIIWIFYMQLPVFWPVLSHFFKNEILSNCSAAPKILI